MAMVNFFIMGLVLVHQRGLVKLATGLQVMDC